MRRKYIFLGFLCLASQVLPFPVYSEEYKTKAGFILNFAEPPKADRKDVFVHHNGQWLPEGQASMAMREEIADQYDKEVIDDPIAYRSPNGGVAHFGDENGNRVSKEEYIRLAQLQMEQSLVETDKAEAHIRATTTPEIYAINQPALEEGRQMARQFFEDIKKSLEGIERPSGVAQGVAHPSEGGMATGQDRSSQSLPNMVRTSIVPMTVLQVDELVSATTPKANEADIVIKDLVMQEKFATEGAMRSEAEPTKVESPRCLVSYEAGFKGPSAG